MNCPNCGYDGLAVDAKFCSQCGTAVVVAPKGRDAVPGSVAELAARFAGRRWVLDEVADWLDNGLERTLMITGEPGSGKTAIAAWLAGAGPANGNAALDRLRQTWGAVHFCVARGQRGTVNPGRFARSLASQLAAAYDDFALAAIERTAPEYNIRQEVRSNWGNVIGIKTDQLIINGIDPEDIYDRAVREPLTVLLAQQPDLQVAILVDGLDEALTGGEPDIVTLLAGSDDLPAGVRFLLTSRNERRVLDQFYDLRLLDLSAAENAGRNEADIRAYLHERLADESLARRLGSQHSAMEIEDHLVSQAEGNFLYVAFLLDEVARDRRALDDLASLPAGLYGLYRAYLDRLMPQMRQYGSSHAWLKQYQPLLGNLSVAVPAAPEVILPRWLGWSPDAVSARLDDVDQVTETIPDVLDQGNGFRLYHRSMAEFLSTRSYQEKRRERRNHYFVAPRLQHDRIVRYYLDKAQGEWQGDWTRCDRYGLRQLIGHMQARLELGDPAEQAQRQAEAAELYRVVLDARFRDAQRGALGDAFTTMSDLRGALDIALARGDLVHVLRIVAAYHDTIRSQTITQAIFDAVNSGDFQRALQGGAHYGVGPKPRGRWARVLQYYLAWEAAEAGQPEAARQAIHEAEQLLRTPADELCDALLARTARRLAQEEGEPAGWLAELASQQDAQSLLHAHQPARQLAPDEVSYLQAEIDIVLAEMEALVNEGEAEGVSMPHFLDDEYQAMRASTIQHDLTRLAWHEAGQERIDRALALVVGNPYPRYRDIALIALGIAIAAAPERSWVRERLQHLLRAALDNEGVTFTFDLPSILLAEAGHRGLAAPPLTDYINTTRQTRDRWGTAMRALSAQAAAVAWQGDHDRALDLLLEASTLPTGYAGYSTLTLLALANRCWELGRPEQAALPIWGRDHDISLVDWAMSRAWDVRDPQFRDERVALVQTYLTWLDQPTPDMAEVRQALAAMPDPDLRHTFKDHISARWSRELQPEAEGLKALVPLLLADSTTLDAVLGRLFGLHIRDLSDEDLAQAMDVCAGHLTTGRPWELGQYR